MNSSDYEEADVDQNAILAGFMFGNIDETGHLEDDFLDEECKSRIGNLTTLCGGGLVRGIADDGDSNNYDDDDSRENTDADEKSDGAEDYFDINEAMDVEESPEVVPLGTWKAAAGQANGAARPADQDDYDVCDYDADGEEVEESRRPEDKANQPKSSSTVQSVANKPMMQTPLASAIPKAFMDIDVRFFFPEFKTGVLRFNKMIPPAHHLNIWKKKKKKKGPEQEKRESRRDPPDQKSSRWVDEEGRVHWRLSRSPTLEEIEPDEGELMMQEDSNQGAAAEERSQDVLDASIWRHGPSRTWYDVLGVSEDGKGFSFTNHGFKLKQTGAEDPTTAASQKTTTGASTSETQSTASSAAAAATATSQSVEDKKEFSDDDIDEPPTKRTKVEIPEEAHLMISQYHWEDDVIRNGEDIKAQVLEELGRRVPVCGWIPTATTRSFKEYMAKYHLDISMNHSYSILPMANHTLATGEWTKDIIWDAQAMDSIPEPRILTLDRDDDNLVLNVPDESEIASKEKQLLLQQQQQQQQQQQETANTKKEKELKKSKAAPNKTKDEEEAQQEESEINRKNPFNLSSDEYYNPKLTTDNALGRNLGVSMILHSTPALELMQPYFPCHLTLAKLRNFHRPHLKKYMNGPMVGPGPHPVLSLVKQIRRKEKIREQERLDAGGGDIFFMRTPADLTGRDGEIVLAEYSEQYPPLLNQIGMATKIKNYYKRKPGNYESDPPQFVYGELAYAHTSPFLGSLQPGQSLQAFENNMFRAPVYPHKIPAFDFLVIRNRNHYYIREVDGLFAVGQECPLMEVPCPGSKKANTFQRDFLQLFIYRLFRMSHEKPERIKMEEVRKAFPFQSESSVRKRLKLCADFRRTGIDSNWWVMKPNARLPSEEELREMVSPEQCCAYYSMQAARQRLNDAGYPDKSLMAPEEDNDETSKMEDEPKASPWHTTTAFISAMKGRCLLQLNGFADPTGCGEGFSYVKIPNKPQPGKDDQAGQNAMKRSVMGTDADLRKLPLKEAKNLLKKLGVDEATVNKMGRWEVIDQIRTRSTEQAKSSQDGGGITKFARGNRFSLAEYHERYKEECQRIFDLQNKILASDEVLSSDDDWSSAEESDLEEMGKNIENMLSSKKTTSQLSLEREEAERKELNKFIKGVIGGDKQANKKDKRNDASGANAPSANRKLKITRRFRGEDGREYTRVEIVKKQNIIDKYIRIRESKDKTYLQQFSILDDQQKEEMKREKKRLQEQLRRIKRMEDGTTSQNDSTKKKSSSSKSSKPLKPNKLKCGACGQTGHMRTNRECPMFSKPSAPTGAVGNVALSEEQQEELERNDLKDEALINIEGTKVTLSKQLIKHAEDIKKKSLVLKFPKMSKEDKKRKMSTMSLQDDYLKKPKKLFNRRRADPVVTLSTIFEGILNEMRELPCSVQFLFPVNAKQVSDYYDVVKKPMCLQTIRENLRLRKYQSREDFLVDVNHIVRNCELYNGANSPLTASARQMFEHCLQRIAEKEDKLMKLEKAINPLLDDDDMVSFSYILTSTIEDRLKTIEGSVPFHTPVNKKLYKDYYVTIKNPMDLLTMHRKATEHQYFCRDDFLKDLELLVSNCRTYNGPNSPLTATATRILETGIEALDEQDPSVRSLERNIMATREAAFDAVDTDSIVTGGDFDESSRAPKFTVGGDESSLMSVEDEDGEGGVAAAARRLEDDDEEEDDDDGDDLDRSAFAEGRQHQQHPFAGLGRSQTMDSDMLSALQQELEISESSDSDDDGGGGAGVGDSSNQGRNLWESFGVAGDPGLEDGEIGEDSEFPPQDVSGDNDEQDMDVD